MRVKARTPPDGNEAYGLQQVAWICRVIPRSIANWMDAGIIKGYRLPVVDTKEGERRILHADLRAFLTSNGMPTDRLETVSKPVVVAVGLEPAIVDGLGEHLGTAEVIEAPNTFTAGMLVATKNPVLIILDAAIGVMDAKIIISASRATISDGLPIYIVATAEESGAFVGGGCNVFLRPVKVSAMAAKIRDKIHV